MDALRSWVLGLTAGALVCSVLAALAPKGKNGAAFRLACGLVTAVLLLGPLRNFDFASCAARLAAGRRAGESLAAEAAEEGRQRRLEVIGQECGAYIWDKAADLGVENFTVRVTVREESGTGLPQPYSAVLGGEAADAKKAELSRWIEGELGIPRERQKWGEADEA